MTWKENRFPAVNCRAIFNRAGGARERDSLVEIAKKDYRDLIVAAEHVRKPPEL